MQSLERALRVLDGFGPRQLGVSEVAREQGLTKSTAFRLLSTLSRHGYLQQDRATGRYRLGLRLLDLGQTVANGLDIRRVARPTMVALTERTRGTSFLAVLEGDRLVNVEQVDSPEPIRLVFEGARLGHLPHTIATGKVLLAELPDDERERVIARLEMVPLTSNTIVDRDRLRAELERVKLQGFAVNDQEQVIGIRGIAAPVYGRDGSVVAAVSAAAPSARLTLEQVPTFAAWVKAAAGEISRNLGAPSPIRAGAGS